MANPNKKGAVTPTDDTLLNKPISPETDILFHPITWAEAEIIIRSMRYYGTNLEQKLAKLMLLSDLQQIRHIKIIFEHHWNKHEKFIREHRDLFS